MKPGYKAAITCALIVLVLTAVSCAPGNVKFDDKPAGFWSGLWHGFICVFTFIIGLFTDKVNLYEVNNSGNWYDFGFLLGAAIFLGGGTGSSGKKRKARKNKEKEWEEIGEKVEGKVRKGIESWLDEEKQKDDDWETIGRKVEEKIKRELRKWAEK
jgi:high-affinity Fe2+/Pb2+ permease